LKQTTQGKLSATQYVILSKISFAEFAYNCHIGTIKALIFEGDGLRYDLIICRQALKKMQQHLDFQKEKTLWFGNEVPFHSLSKGFQDN
jgi:hypothetical protein